MALNILRQTADYNCALEITQADAGRFASTAASFVEAITNLVENE